MKPLKQQPAFRIIVIIAAMYAQLGFAQCNDDEKIPECMSRHQQSNPAAGVTPQSITQQEFQESLRQLKVTTTGDVALNAFGVPVSLNDFLPLLNVAFDPGTGDDDGEQAILEYSPEQEILYGDFKFSAAFKKPTLAEGIKENVDAETLAAIDDGFDIVDDITVDVSYAYTDNIGSQHFGRSLPLYDDISQLVADLSLKEVSGAIGAPDRMLPVSIASSLQADLAISQLSTFAELRVALSKHLKQQLGAGRPAFFARFSGASTSSMTVEYLYAQCKDEAARHDQLGTAASDIPQYLANCMVGALATVATNAGNANAALLSNYKSALSRNGFFALTDLINNQPQLVFSARYRDRDELAGADEYSFKASLEIDLTNRNVNDLLHVLNRGSECAGFDIKDVNSVSPACQQRITGYLQSTETNEGAWRLSLNAEYVDIDDIDVAIPGSEDRFMSDGGDKLIAALSAGRSFQLSGVNNLPRGKLDIGISYEDVSDDPLRQSRTLGNVTFTQEISQGFQATLGLVWANKAEYRAASDEDITARLGLNYKFGGPDK